MHSGDFSGMLDRPHRRSAVHHLRSGDPRSHRRRALSSQTPFPGNKIPSNRFDKVGTAILGYYPATEKTPDRCRRPQQLPGRHHRGKGQVLQRHLPRRPEHRRPAALLRPLQHLHPQQHLQRVLQQRVRRRPVLLLLQERGLRSRLHAFAHHGAEHPVQLQPLHPRRRPAGRSSRLRPGFARLLAAVHQPGPEGPGALPAHQPAPAISATGTPTRTARSTTTPSPPRSPNRRARIPSAPASNTASTRKPISSRATSRPASSPSAPPGPADRWITPPAPRAASANPWPNSCSASRIPAASPASRITSSSPVPGASSCRTIGRSPRS